MTYPDEPSSIYDEILEDRDLVTHKDTTIPISQDVVTEIAERQGQEEVELSTPDGGSVTITDNVFKDSFRDEVPGEDQLVEDLYAAQQGFDDEAVRTLDNVFQSTMAPLHFTDSSAQYVVTDGVFLGMNQRGTDRVPKEYASVGVKAAHTLQGFNRVEHLPHDWLDDLGWSATRDEITNAAHDPETEVSDLEPSLPDRDKSWIINVPIPFPAQSFGQATHCPSKLVTSRIGQVEHHLKETLLTKRLAQFEELILATDLLEMEIERGLIDDSRIKTTDLETITQETFGMSESGFRSLKSQRKTRRRKAFQTVRRLSDSDDFDYVMSEFAETIDDLGKLAMLGSEYRKQQGKSPGFY